MSVPGEQLATVIQKLHGRVICAHCADTFVEVVEAVRQERPWPDSQPGDDPPSQ